MLSRKLSLLSLAICYGAAQPVLAKNGLTINGGEGAVNPMSSLSVAGATHRTTTNTYTVQFRASCFGTNLRGVANPIAPNATVTMSGNVQIDGNSPQPFSISFPAAAALNGNTSAAVLSSSSLPAGSSLAFSGNMLVAKIKSSASTSINPVTAEITTVQQRFEIRDINFTQVVPDSGYGEYSYYGYSGVLSSSPINISQSSDGKVVDIETSFPGQEGFCGGYHSPLMVFLDEKIPKFNNIVDFNMGHGLKTYWPEKNHDGYFVALPNKKGIVDSNKDLFGETAEHHNGFEKLATHDVNKDGVIDSKDPVFKKLVLWKDKGGKGVYSSKDSVPLSQLIKSINLNFKASIMQVSASAELREKSTIVMAQPSKFPKAYIVDVWFKPAFGNENELNIPKLSSK
jgi:hypothetical protein